MIDSLFFKRLGCEVPEQEWLEQIKNSKQNIWWTAVNQPDGTLKFVIDKPNSQFYLAKLVKFPNIVEHLQSLFPDLIVENSYITKCAPHYHMVPHIDPGRQTAIIIPLGHNKGKLSFYFFGKKVYSLDYSGPTLTRVNINHSAENDSDDIRYGITIEVPGSYFTNYLTR